ncbi:NADH dehydrogenase [ubiquinone] 1 beta subcomplex subunit NP15.6 [Oratosquilla oratoria]|uniref:NADH dehydrogenase [ubiquinone] 1 beta subcomplex subunit NP15.6 n=1 Tax=Oratosquilla oratoria TaxID=337810 RepID=UPI003F76F07D
MAALTRLGRAAFRLNHAAVRPNMTRIAGISTSKKNKDTITVTEPLIKESEAKTEAVAETKNWVSWGFSIRSEEEDNSMMHLMFFFTVTVCLVGGGFILAYMPDYRMRDWAQREGFLELRRREAEGLPLIDPNLINPENFELPDDEEIGDVEIII